MRRHVDLVELIGFGEEVEAVRAGENLFTEGDYGNSMYLVKSGSIDVMVGGKLLATVGAGEVLGEMALIDQPRRSATAVASTDSELICINERRFLQMVEKQPVFALAVLETICRRLRTMNQLT